MATTTVLFERRLSAAAIWSRRTAAFSAVLLVVATLGHRFGLIETPPFFWTLCIVAGLAVLALILAGIGFFRLWQRGDKGGRASTRGVLIALLVLVPFGIAAYRGLTLPRLTDISTDPLDPPDFSFAKTNRTPGMNPIGAIGTDQAQIQADAYPAVTGRRYSLPVDRLEEIVVSAAGNLGWTVEGTPQAPAEATQVTVEAVAPSWIFGFVSDVAIRINDEGETSYVDVRSASRYGPLDLGDNATKIGSLFDEIDAEIQASSAPALQ